MAEKVQFHVYNSKTKKKEVFQSKEPGKVKMYVCGVTPYDFSHIGHARAYVAFDILYRYLEYLGYEVVYVRNLTDISDKAIKRAEVSQEVDDPIALSARFSQEFLKDMDDLQCLRPTHQPLVTEHIEQIIHMINKIVTNGYGYTIDGDVFFSVDSFPEYGRGLSATRKLEDSIPRAKVDLRKRNPAFDFVLWKAAKPGEPSWDSPWGPGRPGWHIECSAMSAHYLTHSFDIHGGGMDLIFPHHENEMAQSVAACGPESHVSYWMHIGFVTNKGKKMSKSLNNFFTIREVTRWYHPLALRYFLLGTHYRSPVNYSVSQIEIASYSVFNIYQTLYDCEQALSSSSEVVVNEPVAVRVIPEARNCIKELRNELETELADDLRTPKIINVALHKALTLMNTYLHKLKKKRTKQEQEELILSLNELQKEVKDVLNVLGMLAADSTPGEIIQQLKEGALKRAELTEEDLLRLIEERELSRKNRDFVRSDQIRIDLAAKGIALMDETTQTTWRPCEKSNH